MPSGGGIHAINRAGLRDQFGIEVELPTDEMAKLQKIDALVQVGDFRPDPELMQWADREG